MSTVENPRSYFEALLEHKEEYGIEKKDIDVKATGEKIKALAEENSLSVTDIQDYLELSCPQPVYRWFQGKTLPSINHLVRLCDIFRVKIDDILARENPYNIKIITKKEESLRKSQQEKRFMTYYNLLHRH